MGILNHTTEIAREGTLEYVVAGSLREQESGVVDIADVQDPIGLSRRSLQEQVDDTVGDGLAVHKGIHLAFTFKRLGEGELVPVRNTSRFGDGDR